MSSFKQSLRMLLGIEPTTIHPSLDTVPTAEHLVTARAFYRWQHNIDRIDMLAPTPEQDREIRQLARALAISTSSE